MLFGKKKQEEKPELYDAQEIIRKANYKALEILEGSNIFTRGLRHDMHRSIDKLSQTLLDTYRQSIEEEKSKNIKTIEEVSSQVRQELVKEIFDFKENLQKETIESQSLVEEKLKDEYERIRQELTTYRINEFKKVDDQIYQIVVKASKNILGKALDLQTHQKLVMDSLEEAKQEGLFL